MRAGIILKVASEKQFRLEHVDGRESSDYECVVS